MKEKDCSMAERLEKIPGLLDSVEDMVSFKEMSFLLNPKIAESFDLSPIFMIFMLTRIDNYLREAKRHIVISDFFEVEGKMKTLEAWVCEFKDCGVKFLSLNEGSELQEKRKLWRHCCEILGVIGMDLWW